MSQITPSQSKCNIALPGINQIYYIEKEHLTYESLVALFLSELKRDNILTNESYDYIKELSSRKSDFNETYKAFTDKLSSYSKKESIEFLYEALKEKGFFNKISITYTKHLSLFPKEQYNIIIYNKNPVFLLIDDILIHNFTSKDDTISFECKTYYELQTSKLQSTTIICDYYVDSLIELESKFKYWTVLLNTYSFCQKEMDESTEEHLIYSQVVNYFKNNTIYKESKYLINEHIHFISSNFFQLHYYYSLLNSKYKSSSSYKEFTNELSSTLKPKIVVIFTRTLVRKQEFLKQKFYISNEKVLYKSFINSDEINVNGQFDWILSKAVEVKDMILYKKAFDNIPLYVKQINAKMINNITNFEYFVEKNKQEELLHKFVSSKEVSQLEQDYHIQIKIPNYIIIPLPELLKKDRTIETLNTNKMEFPIIIKYKGESSYFKHLITMIFNIEGYSKYISFMNNLNEKIDDAVCVVQSYINHGDHVIKMYHINNKNYFDYRSSLLDLSEQLMKEYKDNYWTFKTIELEDKTYIENIWKKYRKENFIQNIIEKDSNKKLFVEKVCDTFASYAQMNLIGVDLLYDYNRNEFHLIDVNALPSYKIKNFDHAAEIRQFIIDN